LEAVRSPLFILVGVQTALVAALFFRTSDLEKSVDAAIAAAPSRADLANPVATAYPFSPSSLTEGEIRAILRDEFVALKAALADGAVAAPSPAPERTAQTDRAFTDVQQQMRRLIAKGTASEAEMAALEMQIAELPAEQRRQALSQLSRAVSNGSLKARM
jgi:hypothetical protein